MKISSVAVELIFRPWSMGTWWRHNSPAWVSNSMKLRCSATAWGRFVRGQATSFYRAAGLAVAWERLGRAASGWWGVA